MDKRSKLERRLTIVANLAVVVGIVFLALEMRQNTNMMRAQIRDSLTSKQMEYESWFATNPQLADINSRVGGAAEEVNRIAAVGGIGNAESVQWINAYIAQSREWENSFYQYESGLFTEPEFEARVWVWRNVLLDRALSETVRLVWSLYREGFAPDFRAQIDAIVAEIEN